jgi:hypothetical protein
MKNDEVEYLARRREEDKCIEFQLQNFVEGITLNILLRWKDGSNNATCI